MQAVELREPLFWAMTLVSVLFGVGMQLCAVPAAELCIPKGKEKINYIYP